MPVMCDYKITLYMTIHVTYIIIHLPGETAWYVIKTQVKITLVNLSQVKLFVVKLILYVRSGKQQAPGLLDNKRVES